MKAPIAQQKQRERGGTSTPSSDHETFLSLLESHQRLLHKVCWAYTRTSHDRDDLFQEIIGRLWAAFGKYDRERKFSTWMYRVALNVAIDLQRRKQRQGKVTRRLDDSQAAIPSVAHQDTTKQEQLEELRELLERQSDADRAILLLYLEGNSYREIGEVIGVSESNVGTRLNRLKKSLRESVQAPRN